jgi:hypothetical protein
MLANFGPGRHLRLRLNLLVFSMGTALLFFPIPAIFQIFVVDRFRIRVGRPSAASAQLNE